MPFEIGKGKDPLTRWRSQAAWRAPSQRVGVCTGSRAQSQTHSAIWTRIFFVSMVSRPDDAVHRLRPADVGTPVLIEN
jgi:hypothetical protein